MKKLIRLINDSFIAIILTVFYITAIGLTAVLHRLVKSRARHRESYWNDSKKDGVVDFESAY